MRKVLSMILMLIFLLSAMPALAENEAVSFSYLGSGLEEQTVNQILASYTEETGVLTEPVHITDGYMTSLTTMASASTLPDAGYLDIAYAINWGEEGMLEDLTGLFSQEQLDSYVEGAKYYTRDGKLIGISGALETIVLFYNKNMFDQAGIPYPPTDPDEAWTWEEFLDVCNQLTVDGNGKHPDEEGFDANNIISYGVSIPKFSIYLECLLRSNYGGIFSDDYSSLLLDSPETKS